MPLWFDATYRQLAERGRRVLALAYRRCDGSRDAASAPREWVESGLQFAGFIAFECKTRADSHIVIEALKSSSHTYAVFASHTSAVACSTATLR